MPQIYTNIIAGSYKGKKLQLPQFGTTRASKKILRESFFNTISYDIIDTVFVELFAGSGSMGLEALSRGAKRAVFFEKDPLAFKILKQNIDSFNAGNAISINADSFKMFEQNMTSIFRSDMKAYFYFDPPFSTREGQEDVYKKTIDLIKTIPIKNIHLVCIEHISIVSFEDAIGNLEKIKVKKFGKSTLSYFKVKQ